MLNEENKKLCWRVLSHFGISNQMRMVIEECSELQKAVCKFFREKDKKTVFALSGPCTENLIEEIIDVIVMCQQMLFILSVDMEEVNRRAIQRLRKRTAQNQFYRRAC